MIGLIYKDIIATKSKIFIMAAILQMALVVLLHFTCKGDTETEVMLSYFASAAMVVMLMLIVFGLETSVLKTDDNRQTDYYLSTPVSKYKYVASKYAYLIGAFLLTTVISIAEIAICKNSEYGRDTARQVWKLMPVIIGACVAVCALELPFYFAFGTGSGSAVKTGLIFILMFVLIAYSLFGDLTIMDNFDFSKIVKFLTQKGLMKKIQILTPVIGSGLFFLSYTISSLLFVRREKYN